MSTKITNRRVRTSTPKTKTGCANCRQRRIKCDEGRPECAKCRGSAWPCPGYMSSSRSTPTPGEHATIVPSSSANSRASSTTLNIRQYNLPFRVPGSQEERIAMNHFYNFAAEDLTGYLPFDFWSRTVLARCQNDAPVRHAAVALGRLHLEYISSPDSSSLQVTPETSDAYNRTCKALRNYPGKQTRPDLALVVTCSAILYAFDLLRDDRRSAMHHLQGAITILNGLKQDQKGSSNDFRDSVEELSSVLSRMDLQASMFDDGRPLGMKLEPDASLKSFDADEAPPFTSLQKAQQEVFVLLHSSFAFLIRNARWKFSDVRSIPSKILTDRAQLLDHFKMCEKRMTILDAQIDPRLRLEQPPTTAGCRQAISEIKLHLLTFRLLLLHSLQDTVMASSPTFDDKAQDILHLARGALAWHTEPLDRRTAEPKFSLQAGIVAPLTLLATKTTSPEVRDAAMSLLRAAGRRREGFYDASQMANLISGLTEQQDATSLDKVHAAEDCSDRKPALEWTYDEVMDVKDYDDEEKRWAGFRRLAIMT